MASTLGVLVPPSLVLILLSDAMLSAHTIAVTATGRSDRVINTQDIFHAALVPAGIFLALCLGVVLDRRTQRGAIADARAADARARALLAAVALALLIVLLGGVAVGYFYAVEAAAMGAFALLVAGLGHGPPAIAKRCSDVLRDAMAMTGALFALLLAATTFTLVLRLLGTADLVGRIVAAIPGGDITAVAVVLAVIGLCAFVLDAFEIIFVIVPIVIPPLLIRVADARWVSVLVLLTLQASFLLPPFGYALMMVRGVLKEPVAVPRLRAGAGAVPRRAMAAAGRWCCCSRSSPTPASRRRTATRLPAAPMSDAEFNKRLQEMIQIPEPPDLEERNRK